MLKMLAFDMDGTLADLYGVSNWLSKLRAYDPTPYLEAKPMWDMDILRKLLEEAQRNGIEIRIVTWLSKESTPEYDKAVRGAKRQWLAEYGFPYDHFHGVKYGTTKADCIRRYLGEDETAILFDDSAQVRKGWRLGEAIDPAVCDIIEILRKIKENKYL